MVIKYSSDRPIHPLRRLLFDLQRFAGGANLYCESCIYFQSNYCDLHQKRMDRRSEACSHYLGKQKL